MLVSLLTLLVITFFPGSAFSQDPSAAYLGKWTGHWFVPGSSYSGALEIEIKKDESGDFLVRFVTYGTSAGTKDNTIKAKIEKGSLVVRTLTTVTHLTVSGDTMSGGYEYISGRFAGEKGLYTLKRKK